MQAREINRLEALLKAAKKEFDARAEVHGEQHEVAVAATMSAAVHEERVLDMQQLVCSAAPFFCPSANLCMLHNACCMLHVAYERVGR